MRARHRAAAARTGCASGRPGRRVPRGRCPASGSRRRTRSSATATTATTTWPTGPGQRDRVHRHPRHRGRLGPSMLRPGPGPDVRVLALHAALHRRAHRPAREDQGRGLARRATGTSTPSRSAWSTRASSPQPDAWYTEAMYRSSARLVRTWRRSTASRWTGSTSSATTTCPAPTASSIPGMHTDPGPYWDWRHYFDLLGAPLRATAGANSGAGHHAAGLHAPTSRCTPAATTSGEPCAPHGSSAVRLTPSRDEDAPLIKDIGPAPGRRRLDGGVNDLGSRVSTGQHTRSPSAAATGRRSGTWARRPGSRTRGRIRRPSGPAGRW